MDKSKQVIAMVCIDNILYVVSWVMEFRFWWVTITYRKVASRSTCYYSGNKFLGGATNRDMPLNKMCFYL